MASSCRTFCSSRSDSRLSGTRKSSNSPTCPSHLQPPPQTNPALRRRESSSPPGDAHKHDLNVGYLAEKHQLVDEESFVAVNPKVPRAYPLTDGVVAHLSSRHDVGHQLGKERRCHGLGPVGHGMEGTEED